MATEYDKRNGFSAQHKVCEMLNAFYKQKQMNYIAEETDEMTEITVAGNFLKSTTDIKP